MKIYPRHLLLLTVFILNTGYVCPQSIILDQSNVFALGTVVKEFHSVGGQSSVYEFKTRGEYINRHSQFFEANTYPYLLEVSDLSINPTSNWCFFTNHTLSASNLYVASNANATLVAGFKISIHPSSTVSSGASFHAYIDPMGFDCQQPESLLASSEYFEHLNIHRIDYEQKKQQELIRLFPNPATTSIVLEFLETVNSDTILIEIYSIMGERLLQRQTAGKQQYQFDLSNYASGVYLLRVLFDNQLLTEKFIRQ
ncbi:MAG: T9SS type A sorting domain-containing protein [Bacteroidales bacterium]|nr:T9SS type A sorting domain-containing protein [Bacteroidales bacterium]